MAEQDLKFLLDELKKVQQDFYRKFGISDIISNSKIFEVLVANGLNHDLIPGHSRSRDARDTAGIYEYKHYKELSSNHSWTFNDYSDSTINSLRSIEAVVFAHIDDRVYPPKFDWFYKVKGGVISNYLAKATLVIRNVRRMINVSPNQLEKLIGVKRSTVADGNGKYSPWLNKIFELVRQIEELTETKGLLTSNKIWELLVASKIGHKVLSEQGGRKGAHDAVDKDGGFYEYKVAKNHSWNFQDISNAVLNKYLEDKGIILAVIDKENMEVKKVYAADPKRVVAKLKEKLRDKESRFLELGKEIRRKQVSLSKGDLELIRAKLIFSK